MFGDVSEVAPRHQPTPPSGMGSGGGMFGDVSEVAPRHQPATHFGAPATSNLFGQDSDDKSFDAVLRAFME